MDENNQEDGSKFFALVLFTGGIIGIGFGIFAAIVSSKQDVINFFIPPALAIFGKITHSGIRLWQKGSGQLKISQNSLRRANSCRLF